MEIAFSAYPARPSSTKTTCKSGFRPRNEMLAAGSRSHNQRNLCLPDNRLVFYRQNLNIIQYHYPFTITTLENILIDTARSYFYVDCANFGDVEAMSGKGGWG